MLQKSIAATFLLGFVAACSVVGIGCSSSSSPSTSAAPASTKATATSTAPGFTVTTRPTTVVSETVTRLRTVSCVDQQGIGAEAFNILVPVDWQFEGGIRWVLDNPAMPAVSDFRVWNPKGTEQFRVYPDQAFFWTDNPMTAEMFPPGSRYFGAEVRQPVGSLEALQIIVIPKLLPSVQNLKYTKKEEVNLSLSGAEVGQSGLPTSYKAGKVRVEYSESGKTYEDEVYCVVQTTQIPLQTLFGPKTNTTWTVGYIASFRAEKGKLDAGSKLFQTISGSLTLNLKWFNKYVQVVEALIKMQIQQIQSIGQLGTIIAQTSEQIRQENLALYEQREAASDRVSTQFSEYIRGVDSYFDPSGGKNVELPSGYNNVWADSSGNYAMSDNPSYNPNIGDNRNWTRLEKAGK